MKKTKLITAVLMLCLTASVIAQNTATEDEGVVINGVTWATRNVDAPGTFVATPESAGMFYQWNRSIGWSSIASLQSAPSGRTWDSTIPTGTEWNATNNPCPSGWRIPTMAQFQSLAEMNNDKVTVNGITGRLFGSGDNTIFLPFAGYRFGNNGALDAVGTAGNYWGNVRRMAICPLSATVDTMGIPYYEYGFSVRCVKDGGTASDETISANNEKTAIAFYNTMGIKLPQAPESGIYIILYDNGTAEKVIK